MKTFSINNIANSSPPFEKGDIFTISGTFVKRTWLERLFSWPWEPWKSESNELQKFRIG